jgi:NADH dehydrogenase
MVVIMEIGIGLALIGGLFTFLASLASIFMALNFILSAMAGKEILWYIFAGIALMGGAGRAFGLDYYVMPWIKKWWNKTKFARKTYLFID